MLPIDLFAVQIDSSLILGSVESRDYRVKFRLYTRAKAAACNFNGAVCAPETFLAAKESRFGGEGSTRPLET